jgi:hypothetical protein
VDINKTDATLLGTEHSTYDQGYVTTKYQFRFDNSSLKINAYLQCKS